MTGSSIQKCPEHPDWNVSGACSRCGRFTCVVCVDLAPPYAKQECSACLDRRTIVLQRSRPTEYLMFCLAVAGGGLFAAVIALGSMDATVGAICGAVFAAAIASIITATLRRQVARWIAFGMCVVFYGASVFRAAVIGPFALWVVFSQRLRAAITHAPPPS